MERYFHKKSRNSVDSDSGSGSCSIPILTPNTIHIPRVVPILESNIDGVVGDPGLRKSIEEYDIGIRDRIRREYISKGPCQPKGHIFPKTQFGPSMRSFRDDWFKTHDWLEYSISKDAAYCFCCYLFKPS